MTVALELLPGQVKSRLLPLSPLASALEWLIERLPRRLIKVELKSADGVVILNESKGEFKSTSDAPSFEMTLVPASSQGGWHYLEAALVRNNGSREANIRANIRGEGKESITIPIPTNLRGTVREVIYLPPNVTVLHWSPTAAPGFFSQSQLLFHKITPLESTLRQMSRVIFDLWRFRNRAPATRAGLTWWGAISNLQDAYRRTATLRLKRLMGNDYLSFIALNDTLKKSDIRAMRKQVPQLSLRPVISLIMPVQDPIEEFFRAALDSVSGQIYPHWELLLAGDFSADTQSLAIANEFRSKNAQVKIVSFKPGADLATTLNSALELAQGEFVARINQHDRIPPHALFMLAREISKHPDADLIYTDDDNIDDTNKRLDPRFKPDWNPDLFFSYNYLTNLILYRHTRALELSGYRPGFEGAEDYDLALRYLRDTPATKIRHIPRVLYHSRAYGQAVGSTPSHDRGGGSAHQSTTPSPLRGEGWGEGTAHQSGKRALSAYFEGSGITVEDGPAPSLYRIRHPLPAQPPLVSIIIPTRDRVEILKKCIESIQQKTDYENWEMLVVDNQSVEPQTHTYFEQIQRDTRIKVIRYEKPFNYSAMNNYAVQFSQGEILALLNNDVEVITGEWLSEMVSHAMRPEIGAVGAKLLYSNGLVQHAGVILGIGGVAGHAHKYLKGCDHGYCHRAIISQNLSAVTGACLVVRKSIHEEVGGLNEVSLAVAFNDIDFCLKLLAAGYQNIYTPYAKLYHHESISRGHNDTPEKHAVYAQELDYMKNSWGDRLKLDPAYNPNLTLEFENFFLRS
jgi:glycosyltransferase involved in cell wall biosynthesis